MKRLSTLVLVCATLAALLPIGGFAQDSDAALHHVPALHDGQHDFDFNFGHWKTHIHRRLHPFTDNKDVMEMNGTVSVQKVWNGKAQIEVIEADGPKGHFEGT